MTKEEAEAKLKTVNFEELERALFEKTGYNIKLQWSVEERLNRIILNVEDLTDYTNQTGIMSCIYEEVKIKNFGGDIIEENGEWRIWLPMNFYFTYKNGGSNGADILTGFYKNNEWIIR